MWVCGPGNLVIRARLERPSRKSEFQNYDRNLGKLLSWLVGCWDFSGE